jgi:hypothetical protein
MPSPMISRSLVLCALATTLGCTAHEGDAPTKPNAPKTAQPESKPEPEPEPDPEPEPEPEPQRVLAKASIASVVMIEDCPDRAPLPPAPTTLNRGMPMPPPSAVVPKDEAAQKAPADEAPSAELAPGAAAKMAPGAALGDSPHGWSPPCSQSTMQISFTGQGDTPGRVVIERVRLLEPGTFEELGRLSVRHPAAWTESGYFAWDEILPAGGSVKASYSLGLPNWSDVERKKAGASSYGHMFVLEVEVSIDGVSQTVRSQEFPREEAHVVVT